MIRATNIGVELWRTYHFLLGSFETLGDKFRDGGELLQRWRINRGCRRRGRCALV